ncbi:MAG: SH3 domain-containing protein [Anaerolineae bacterium]|nr:SH3 domain-containing protein [Anaerolineae bacterium]
MAARGAVAAPASNNTACRVRVDVNALNMRAGPGTTFPVLSQLSLAAEVPAVGRLSDGSWLEVNQGGTRGWVSAAYTALLGNCNLSVTTPPASPTPVASPTPLQQAQQQPNLVVATLNGASSITLAGGEVVSSYLLQVRNAGNAPTGAFNVTIFFPDGTAFDYVINELQPGAQSNIDGLTVTFGSPGTYRLEVFVDSSNNIAESNESDNGAFLDIVVSAATP